MMLSTFQQKDIVRRYLEMHNRLLQNAATFAGNVVSVKLEKIIIIITYLLLIVVA